MLYLCHWQWNGEKHLPEGTEVIFKTRSGSGRSGYVLVATNNNIAKVTDGGHAILDPKPITSPKDLIIRERKVGEVLFQENHLARSGRALIIGNIIFVSSQNAGFLIGAKGWKAKALRRHLGLSIKVLPEEKSVYYFRCDGFPESSFRLDEEDITKMNLPPGQKICLLEEVTGGSNEWWWRIYKI